MCPRAVSLGIVLLFTVGGAVIADKTVDFGALAVRTTDQAHPAGPLGSCKAGWRINVSKDKSTASGSTTRHHEVCRLARGGPSDLRSQISENAKTHPGR